MGDLYRKGINYVVKQNNWYDMKLILALSERDKRNNKVTMTIE